LECALYVGSACLGRWRVSLVGGDERAKLTREQALLILLCGAFQ
jgi:hypothetical protein